MEKVTGIGGFFFRSNDPKSLSDWYREHLGIDMSNYAWMQEEGPTVFQPFEQETDYLGNPDRQWMINFRVGNLTVLIAQLRAADIDVETRAEWDSEIGRFARIHDLEGNPIELWEPVQP